MHNGERVDTIVVDEEEDAKQLKSARKEALDDDNASSWADCESRGESNGLIRAKTLSRAANEGLDLESWNEEHQMEGTPICSSMRSTAGSRAGSDTDNTTCQEGCQLGAMAKQVREPKHFPAYILQLLLSKIESLNHVIDEERKEAREREQQLVSKISEMEKSSRFCQRLMRCQNHSKRKGKRQKTENNACRPGLESLKKPLQASMRRLRRATQMAATRSTSLRPGTE